jgi:hypothetical protein
MLDSPRVKCLGSPDIFGRAWTPTTFATQAAAGTTRTAGEVEFVISIDSTSPLFLAHQHAAGRGKEGCSEEVEALAIDGEALGSSRGGLTSKLHVAVDGFEQPVAVILTPCQAGDSPQLLTISQPLHFVCFVILAELLARRGGLVARGRGLRVCAVQVARTPDDEWDLPPVGR